MAGVVLLVLIGVGFYAFIGTASKQATEMFLAAMWALTIIFGVGSTLYELLR